MVVLLAGHHHGVKPLRKSNYRFFALYRATKIIFIIVQLKGMCAVVSWTDWRESRYKINSITIPASATYIIISMDICFKNQLPINLSFCLRSTLSLPRPSQHEMVDDTRRRWRRRRCCPSHNLLLFCSYNRLNSRRLRRRTGSIVGHKITVWCGWSGLVDGRHIIESI